ncbi:MAG: hypothetical protein ACE5JX_16425 [Acidobacteriota bacterium]
MRVRPVWGVFERFLGDLANQLETERRYAGLLVMLSGLLVAWWVYVPIHELMHAAGCVLAGGEVSRLEIGPLYGGRWLARLLPFVVAQGGYAGRLSGFDSGGSDWVYASTVAFPFLLSFAGFALTRAAVNRRNRFAFGFALPLAFSPLLSLTGDWLELGSLLMFNLWPGEDGIHRALISDDLFRTVRNTSWSGSKILFTSLSQLVGVCLAWCLTSLAGQTCRRH